MKIYLAGRMEGITEKESMGWRDKIIKLSPFNFKFFVPKITEDAQGSFNADRWLIDKADIVLVKIDKEASWGTAMEIMYAWIKGKLIICFTKEKIEFHGWLKHVSMVCLKVQYINDVVKFLIDLKKQIR